MEEEKNEAAAAAPDNNDEATTAAVGDEKAPAAAAAAAAAASTATNKKTTGPASRKNKRDSLNISTHSTDSKGNPKTGGGPKTPAENKKRQSISASTHSATAAAAAAAAAGNVKDQLLSASGHSPGPAMDVHPYPRGAVIEVLYIPATAVGQTTASIQAAMSGDQWYWSEDSSLCTTTSDSSVDGMDADNMETEELDGREGDVAMPDATEKIDTKKKKKETKKAQKEEDNNKEHHHHHHHHHHQNAASVRLCDIIDRVPLGDAATTGGQQNWRYYVHYRDFNRRMDEWVPKDRIVSPPSIGNAKARALKREEERVKRKQQRLEEKQRAEKEKMEQKILADVDISAPRSSRRRSSVIQAPPAATNIAPGAAPAGPNQPPAVGAGAVTPQVGADAAAAAEGVEKGRRNTRLRRRSIHANDDDAATVVAGNQAEEEATKEKAPAAVKEILTLPAGNTSEMATMTVGEHVVATVAAQELDEHEGLDEASLREHEEITKIKNVSFIELGRHQMETWYFSPIPKELLSQRGYIEVLYICEFTFRMFARKSELQRFQQRSLHPQNRHPPGNEIYRKDNLSMFEVDGLTEKIYCQNLCYIAKLFLDHKTLYFDVDPFLFYVLCEVDDKGYHPVGYFSKEKYSDVGYNLACILTFPAHQRKGYGRVLIAFSYELSKKQEKVGGPERPVSDLGQKAYKPYWAATVIDFLRNTGHETDAEGNLLSSSLSIMDISKQTSIMAEDIVFTLNQLGILKIINGVYFIAAEESLLESLAKKYPVKEPRIDPSKLHWTPFLTDVKRDKFSIHSKKSNLDDNLQINPSGQQQPPPNAQSQPQQQE